MPNINPSVQVFSGLLNTVRANSDLGKFTAKLGGDELKTLKLHTDQNGDFSVHTAKNGRFANKTAQDRQQQTFEVRTHFIEALKQEFGSDYADFVSAEMNKTAPLNREEVRLYTTVGKLLDPELVEIEVITVKVDEHVTNGMLRGRMADTTKNALAALWVKKFDFAGADPANLLYLALEEVPAGDQSFSKVTDLGQSLPETSVEDLSLSAGHDPERSLLGPSGTNGSLLAVLKEVDEKFGPDENGRDCLTMLKQSLEKVADEAIREASHTMSGPFGTNHSDAVPDQIISLAKDRIKEPLAKLGELASVLEQALVSPETRLETLRSVIIENTDPDRFDKVVQHAIDRDFKQFALEEARPLAFALIDDLPHQEIDSARKNDATTELFVEFLELQSEEGPRYDPQKKGHSLAEALFHLAGEQFAEYFERGGSSIAARSQAQNDLNTALERLNAFVESDKVEGDPELQADVRAAAATAATLVKDLSETRLVFTEMRHPAFHEKATAYSCGVGKAADAFSPLQNFLMFEGDDNLFNETGLADFKDAIISLNHTQGMFNDQYNEEGDLAYRSPVDKKMLKKALDAVDARDKENSHSAFFDPDKPNFGYSLLLAKAFNLDEAPFSRLISTGVEIVKTMQPNIMKDYAKNDLDPLLLEISGNGKPEDDDDFEPGYATDVLAQIDGNLNNLNFGADLWSDENLLGRLDGTTRDIMEQFGRQVSVLRDMFIDPEGPVAKLRQMAEMAQMDPVRFAASLSARQDGLI